MRIIAAVLLPIFVFVVCFGILFVPRQDGVLTDTLLTVVLPAVGIAWCLLRLLPRPRHRT